MLFSFRRIVNTFVCEFFVRYAWIRQNSTEIFDEDTMYLLRNLNGDLLHVLETRDGLAVIPIEIIRSVHARFRACK